jgi:YbbR domain-containing protein
VAYRLFPINLPVFVNKVGTLPDNIVLKNILISPGSVRVQAPSKLIKKKVAISTEGIDLSGITETATLEPKLIFPPEIRFQNGVVPRISVTIQVESKKKTRK